VVTPGTLLAVFLATSDEMLPIFLGEGIAPVRILTVLGIKLAVALLVGFSVDFLMRGHLREIEVAQLCGFSSIHYFSRKFKKKTGVSPSEYNKK
jgi:AraC-like DNA-binding protein